LPADWQNASRWKRDARGVMSGFVLLPSVVFIGAMICWELSDIRKVLREIAAALRGQS